VNVGIAARDVVMATAARSGPLVVGSGLVIVDKAPRMTSHDVVAQIRRLAGTRRVGHAGTLDPMATGVLVLGVEKATRLLGYLALTEKEYTGTIRLGQTTVTDDAEGELLTPPHAPGGRASGITEPELRAALATFTGQIQQVPPKVSAIKVKGRRAYHLTRSGAAPELAPRAVTISRLELTGRRPVGGLLDVDVEVSCSSGTYIRSLARDLGAALGVGGHLTALRRTRVGPFLVGEARTLEQLAEVFDVFPLEQAACAAFCWVELGAQEAWQASHGIKLPAIDPRRLRPPAGAVLQAADQGRPVAAVGPDGQLIALLGARGGEMQPIAVFTS
jgi:tRNA pseudouridine55 synthase